MEYMDAQAQLRVQREVRFTVLEARKVFPEERAFQFGGGSLDHKSVSVSAHDPEVL